MRASAKEVKMFATFIENNATKIIANGKEYYFLPYWFEKKEFDGFFMHSLGELPEELKKEIEFFRNLDNEKSILSYVRYPKTKDECYEK